MKCINIREFESLKFFEFLGRFGWENGYGKLHNRNVGMKENFVASLACVWQGRGKGGKKIFI